MVLKVGVAMMLKVGVASVQIKRLTYMYNMM